MTDMSTSDPNRPEWPSSQPSETQPWPPAASSSGSPLPYTPPPAYPPVTEAPPPRSGPLGLGWVWWITGGCALLLMCCLCTMIAAILLLIPSGRFSSPLPSSPAPRVTPAPQATPRRSSVDEAAPAAPVAAPERQAGGPIGTLAPDFQLMSLEGKPVKLSDFRGRPVLLNFWATWCGPCKAEMPLLSKTHEELKDEGLVILAVDVQESPSVVQRYAEQNKLPFLIVLDQTGVVAEHYRVRAYPTTFFIDANGVIQSWQIGTLSKTTLDRHLDRIR